MEVLQLSKSKQILKCNSVLGTLPSQHQLLTKDYLNYDQNFI